jgi:cell pole-organizing protein PopZ
MSQSARVQEPSMEEILASIRRIIADDTPEAAKAAASAVAPAAAPAAAPKAAPSQPAPPAKAMSQDDIDAMLADQAADEESGILDLSEPVKKPQPAPAGFRQVPAGDVMFREEEVEPEAPAYSPPAYAPPTHSAAPTPETLLSAETNAAVSAAFGSLASTILSENSRTIEDLVREMLRPMLKAWLDDNLPGLVERMVRAEIERVARGGR